MFKPNTVYIRGINEANEYFYITSAIFLNSRLLIVSCCIEYYYSYNKMQFDRSDFLGLYECFKMLGRNIKRADGYYDKFTLKEEDANRLLSIAQSNAIRDKEKDIDAATLDSYVKMIVTENFEEMRRIIGNYIKEGGTCLE